MLSAVMVGSGALAAPVLAPAVPAHADPAPVRILLVGDSVTQGSAGDWTWRYRLAQTLHAAGVDFELVGPRDDLADNVAATLGGSDAYADAEFADRSHGARWGMTMVDPDVPMADLVDDYYPDVVVEARGINDLTFYQRSAEQLAGDLSDEVAEARAVDPSVDFVVAALPQTWYDSATGGDVSAYNDALPDLAADLDDQGAGSEVVAAGTGAGFAEYVDTWDEAHLAATGEVKYAAAVADALAELGVGDGAPDALPEVINGHWGAATDLTAQTGDGWVTLTWRRPPGGALTYVWGRDASRGDPWVRLDLPVLGTSWTGLWLNPGHTYEYRLQSAKGTAVAVDYSDVLSVTLPGHADPPDPPSPPAPVAEVLATPGASRLTVDWKPVAGATAYDVSWVGAGGRGGMTTVTAPPLTITDLVGGEAYTVTVTARNDAGPSSPTTATATPGVEVVPTPDPPPPAAPEGVTVTPGSHRLVVGWLPTATAASYEVSWVARSTGGRGSQVVAAGPVAVDGLVAGERYDVTVTARNAVGSGPAAKAVGVPRGPKAPAPARLRAEQVAAHRALLTWRHRPAATSYSVEVRRRGRWEPVRTVEASSTVVGRLPRGVTTFRVRSWHQLVPGARSGAVRVRMR